MALQFLQKLGWKNLAGVGINPEVCQNLQQKGFDVHCTEDFTKLDLLNSHYDVVRMFHVLEHVPDPKQAVHKVHQLSNLGVFLNWCAQL